MEGDTVLTFTFNGVCTNTVTHQQAFRADSRATSVWITYFNILRMRTSEKCPKLISSVQRLLNLRSAQRERDLPKLYRIESQNSYVEWMSHPLFPIRRYPHRKNTISSESCGEQDSEETKSLEDIKLFLKRLIISQYITYHPFQQKRCPHRRF